MRWLLALGLLGSASPALAGGAFDGVYGGDVACEGAGTSPPFAMKAGIIVRDSRFVTERGTAGKNGWERLEGHIETDGTVAVQGRYIAEVEKPIAYRGRISSGRLQVAGTRGPRRCSLDAAPPPPTGAKLPYRMPPDVAARRAAVGRTFPGTFTCPAPPAPVRDVLVEPFYRKDDPTHSIVDPEAYAARAAAAEPLSRLAAGVARLGDRYLAEQPRNAAVADCLATWLDAWASAGALLGTATMQGSYERKWTLATLALNLALLRDAPEVGETRGQRMAAWIADLAYATVPAYAGKPFAEQNNHLNWAALAVLAAGAATGEAGLFEWGIAAARGAIANIDDDGSLPHELKRAAKALHYHRFALEPLILAAEIAAANGIDLYADGRLHHLVGYTVVAMANPDLVARRVGRNQDTVGADGIRPSMYAWAEPYVARFPGGSPAATLQRLRNGGLSSTWLGGNQTLRFATLP